MGIRNWIGRIIHRKPRGGGTTPPRPPAPTDLLQQLLDAHNQARTSRGLLPLRLNNKLNASAGGHAVWMAQHQVMSHNEGLAGPGARISAQGYSAVTWGENIAEGYSTVQAVMTGWMHSTGHRRNILTPEYRDVGFGMIDSYWCADFGSQSSTSTARLMSGPLRA